MWQLTWEAQEIKNYICSVIVITTEVADRIAELRLCEPTANCRLAELSERRRDLTWVAKLQSLIRLAEKRAYRKNDVVTACCDLNVVGISVVGAVVFNILLCKYNTTFLCCV